MQRELGGQALLLMRTWWGLPRPIVFGWNLHPGLGPLLTPGGRDLLSTTTLKSLTLETVRSSPRCGRERWENRAGPPPRVLIYPGSSERFPEYLPFPRFVLQSSSHAVREGLGKEAAVERPRGGVPGTVLLHCSL